MTTIVIYISKSTGLPFSVLRKRVSLHLTGSEVKKLITDEGEFQWLPSEYDLFNSRNNISIDVDTPLVNQGINAESYLYTRIISNDCNP